MDANHQEMRTHEASKPAWPLIPHTKIEASKLTLETKPGRSPPHHAWNPGIREGKKPSA